MDSYCLLEKPKLLGMADLPGPSSCQLFNLPAPSQSILPYSILCMKYTSHRGPHALKFGHYDMLFRVFITLAHSVFLPGMACSPFSTSPANAHDQLSPVVGDALPSPRTE